MKRKFTILMAAFALLTFLAVPLGMRGQTTTVSYGWETSDDATKWTISDAIEATAGQGNTGTNAGKINTNHTYVQFNEKVYVTSFSFAFKRTSNNTNYNVYIETSTDGNTWTAAETYAMGSFLNGTYSTKTHEFDGTTEYYVRFHCYNTTAVRYVDDVTITYAASASQLEPCDLAFTDASTSLVFDLYDNSDSQVINYTTSSTGEVTVVDSDYITAEVDQTNKTITVTPVAVTNGTQTITVNQAADDNYASGSKTFTVNITDSTPFTGGDVTFNPAVDKDLNNTSQGEGTIEKLGVTFTCNNGILGNGSEYRMYKNSVTTFSVSDGTITQIAFTGTSGNPASGFAAQTGWTTDGNNGIWTGNAQEVSFTASGAQVRATLIVVTVEMGSSTDPSVTLTPCSNVYTPISAYQIEFPYLSAGGYLDNVICNNFTTDQFSILFCDADGQPIDTNPDWIIDPAVVYFDNNWCLELASALNEGDARTTYLKVGAANGPVWIYSDLVTVNQAAAPVVYSTIPDLFNAATSTETSVEVNFNNWVISAVKNGNAYLTDNEGNGLIIYQSGHGFQVNDVLSGTASCTLLTYQGAAELKGLTSTTAGLTVTAGGTVNTLTIDINTLTGVNTGALLAYENLTYHNGSNNCLEDGNGNQIYPYNTLYDYGSAFVDGHIYNVTGIYKQYTTSSQDKKEILPRSADDIVEVAVPTITLDYYIPDNHPFTPNSPYQMEFTYWSSGGVIDRVEYNNFPYTLTAQDFHIQHCNAAGEPLGDIPDWYLNGTPSVIPYDGDLLCLDVEVEKNTSSEARTAYFKVYAYDENQNKIYSDLVTVNQAGYVAPSYADLPFAFNYGRDSIPGIDGLSQNGLGTDYNANINPDTQLKFDGTGDWLLLQFDERPGTLTFKIKGNSFSSGTFTVQTSENGIDYTNLDTYTSFGSDVESKEYDNLGENVRYIKWIYTEKGSGNVGLGNIALAAYEVPVTVPYITITPDNYELDANSHMAEVLTRIVYQGIAINPESGYESFDIQYYDADGQEIEQTWCTVGTIAVSGSDDEFDLAIFTVVNEGNEARTAYFKVYGLDAEANLVYSNLVTVTQAALVVDYAVLPFVWEGGASADFLALNGVTANNLGSDYATGNSPYLIKFDHTGDYIQVKTDSQPGKVTIGVKMIGGANTSTITIQGSADGETFTDIEELTISGAQNDTLTLETTNVFGDNDRYVRMLFTKGSNVGVGPITIEKGNAPSINVIPATINLEAAGQIETGYQMQTLTVTYNNLEIEGCEDFAVQFYDAEGQEQTQPDWIMNSPVVVSGGNDEGYIVVLIIAPNEGPARSTYFKVYALGEQDYVYSNLVTINQAGVAQQYTLTVEPFENLELITFVNDEMVMEADGETQANEGDQIMLSIVAAEGYVMETLMVNGVNHVNDIADDFTYTFEMPAENVTISATAVEVVPPTPFAPALYTKVTSMTPGLHYIIVGFNGIDAYAMGGQNNNNRAALAISEDGNTAVVTNESVAEFVIESSGDFFTMNDGTGYLYAASSNSNYLRTKPELDDNGKWAITIAEDGQADVVAQGNNTRRYMRYNASTPLFSCYAESSNVKDKVYFYVKSDEAPEIQTTVTVEGTDFGTPEEPTNAGYRLIASPVNNVNPAAVEGMTTGNYDLYAYDAAEDNEWINYKAGKFHLISGHGYLYAKDSNVTLDFVGQSISEFEGIDLAYSAEDVLKSLTLVGNPFAYSNDFVVTNGTNVDFNYLTLNQDGDGFIIGNTNGSMTKTLAPMEAMFVQAPGANYKFDDFGTIGGGTGEPNMPDSNPDFHYGLLNLKVTRHRGQVIDNALVSFGNAPLMNKFVLNEHATKVYVPMSGKEMAVVRSASQGEMPVSFKAASNGTYTLSVDAENVEMNYLHLIDNMTGTDVDLLQTPSYSFEAKTSDYASRFRIVFSANSSLDEQNTETFAFFNGSEWVISNIGEATLQVVDVMGRVLSSETVNGNATMNIGQVPGIYMLRLVNGNDVKVQKVVVR